VLPELHTNVMTNTQNHADRCHVLPLRWGEPAHLDALFAHVESKGITPPHLIVCAEVVYWEALIDPLLETLAAVTARWRVPVLMAYVQRFKRAKRFFKKARKYFNVRQLRAVDVVDYEALTWGPKGALQGSSGGSAASSSAAATHTEGEGVARVDGEKARRSDVASAPLCVFDKDSALYDVYMKGLVAPPPRRGRSQEERAAETDTVVDGMLDLAFEEPGAQVSESGEGGEHEHCVLLDRMQAFVYMLEPL
jgi:hypothetical protein